MRSDSSLTVERLESIFRDREPGTEDDYKFFSVLVPVVRMRNGLHVLYEVRARHMTRQPGDVCFPGGEMETGETAMECALRETCEDTGINQSRISVVNQLDTIYTYSNFLMYSFLGIMEEEALDDLKLNPDEVDEVFLIPLQELMETEPEIYRAVIVPEIPEDFPYDRVTGGKAYNWRKGRSVLPVYEVGGRVIWGLTARITARFIDAIRGDVCSE